MTKFVAIHEVHLRDKKDKPLVVQPGQHVTITDKEESERLLGLGAIAHPKDATNLLPVTAVTANETDAEDEDEDDILDKEMKKSEKTVDADKADKADKKADKKDEAKKK